MKRLFTLLGVLFIIQISQGQTILAEGFESWPPENWEFYLLGDAVDGWRDDFNGNANTGTGSAYSSIDNAQCDNWMVTPAVSVINNTYVLKFWELHTSPEFYDRATVLVSAGSPDPSDGQFTEVFESNNLNTTLWEERSIDLSAYDGETIHVAFRYEGTFHAWNIDDVSIGPSSFTDGALVEYVSPVGVSETPEIVPVIVELKNTGQTNISEVTVDWQVNSVSQPSFNDNTLALSPGQSTNINLGDFNFSAEGAYEITANLVLADDFEAINNQITTTYDISPLRDGGITAITPEGLVPIDGPIEVKATVTNFGDNIIDIADIDWAVNGISQTPFSTTSLNLQPNETQTVVLGTFNFPEGINEITATLNAFGDTNSNNDSFSANAAINTFFESFEGENFPPEGWSINFGTLDGVNFDTPVDGDFYYVTTVDNNFFGEVSDTLYTPLLNIESGDFFNFYIKTSQFAPANHTLVYKDGVTGDVNTIANIANSSGANNWALRQIDISAAAGINQIGIVSTSTGGNGETKFDLFTSDAELYQFNNDLRILNGDMAFLARQNTTERFECQIRNAGALPVSGADYTVKLMEAPGVELASLSGVDLTSWEFTTISIDYAFSDISQKRLYFEIEYAQDENLRDNTFREAPVSVVPSSVIINEIGSPNNPGFIPFGPNGNTNTLGEDDLSESLYFNEEFNTPGLAYGVAYKYNNLLRANTPKEYPLQVWVTQTNLDNLDNGWTPTEELVLVFDGVVEFLPGNNRDLYIPFNQPVMINGIEDVVIRMFQYDPEWPPAIFRFLTTNPGSGPTRTIGAFDVFDLNPLSPPDFWLPTNDFAYTRFVIDPSSSNSVLSGVVTENGTNAPIENASISITGSSISVQTDSNGNYTLPSLPYGMYEITVNATGYVDEVINLELNSASQTQDFSLTLLADVSITGRYVGSNSISDPLDQVEVVLSQNGTVLETVTTDQNGVFTFLSVFGGSDYAITASLYGYFDKITIASPGATNIDLGDLILNEEFLPPFDVTVEPQGEPTVNWKTPKLSAKVKLQEDFGVVSNSYTNEPNEDVWLGNEFTINEMTTLTSVEFRTDIFALAIDFVSVDIFDVASNTVIASSEPFLIQQDSLQTIDIPNIVVNDNIAAMVHWQNNAESTNSLAVDFSDPNINDVAVIRFPGQPIAPFSSIIGGGFNYAFHVRLNTLDDDTPVTNGESVLYNVYRGLASEFPDTSNWDLLNSSPVSDLSLVDSDVAAVNPNELYRYAVETIYTEGESELTFSNEILGQDILSITDSELLEQKILLYPNPAVDVLTLELMANLQTDQPVELYNLLGKKVMEIDPKAIGGRPVTTNVSALASGVYVVKLSINGTEVTKRFIKN